MAQPNRAPRPTVELKLPTIDQRRVLGGRIVYRAATIMLLVFLVVVTIAIVVSAFVPIRVTVNGSGVVEPVRVIVVRPTQEGLVSRVLVSTGDTVSAGQPLVTLDSLDFRTSVSALEAQYRAQTIAREQLVATEPVDRLRQVAAMAQADAHVVRATATLRDRMVTHGFGTNVDSLVRNYKVGSHVNVDLAMADFHSAQADQRIADAEAKRIDNIALAVSAQDAKLAELRTNLQALRARLQRFVIRAPTAGVVLTDQLERLTGSYVRPGEQMLEIGDPASWRALIQIAESDVSEVRPGDSVTIELAAFRDLKVPRLLGVVGMVGVAPSSIGASPAAVPTTSLFRVVVALDPSQLRAIGVDQFRKGYTATAKITTRRGVILRLVLDNATNAFRRSTANLR